MQRQRVSQGEIWWYYPSQQVDKVHGVLHGERPVVIISNDTFNRVSDVVNCVPLSSVDKKSPVHVFIRRDEPVASKKRQKGPLLYSSYALCEQVLTVSQHNLTAHIGNVTYIEWHEIKKALQFQFNMV